MDKKTGMLLGIVSAVIGLILIVLDWRTRLGPFHPDKITSTGIIGIVLLLAGGVMIIYARNNTALKRRDTVFIIPPEGFVNAEIIGMTRSIRTQLDKEGFHVLARGKDSEGNEVTFTSEVIGTYPGKEIIGKRVHVIFYNDDPEQYLVDLKTVN